jgi:hypothetical protein
MERTPKPPDDPHADDPTIDAPWKDLGPREDLSDEEFTERAARPDADSRN